DLILDGTDNFATRYLINDFAHSRGIAWIYAGAVGSTGRSMAVVPGETACLRCLLPQAAPMGELASCETDGILEPVIAQVSAFQVAQALKILTGNRSKVARGVFTVDVWADEYDLRLRELAASPDCPACGRGDYPALNEEPVRSLSLCGRDAVQIKPPRGSKVDLTRLAERIATVVEDLDLEPQLLRFTAERCRFSVFPGGRTLVMGTSEESRARSLYDRYVGIS
ncbi:MAG: ThiF family adenylyltransferase, partial [Planctomycetota bacterium]